VPSTRRHPSLRHAGAALLLATFAVQLPAQVTPWATTFAPSVDNSPLPLDRGADGLAQTLNKLRTWGSLMMIVAHPDDEDGGMLAYESRGAGIRTTLLTLTRGEGGQNAMSGETYDALGVMRTNELLAADRYYGTHQMWGSEADYGFSKTKEEAFSKWGHERVLRDVVRAIREQRPLVLTSVFIGGITDGHGHHQVAGEITQEAFKAAGDPSVFPDQIAAGLRPWQPLAVFARVPFAPITAKGMYDYATDTWAPPSFTNYVTGEHTVTPPTSDISIPEGNWDPVLGASYLQIAREGWGYQKSQNGGGYPPLAGPEVVGYHRYGSRVQPASATSTATNSFFSGMNVAIPGMILLAHGPTEDFDTGFVAAGLDRMDRAITHAFWGYTPGVPDRIVPDLCEGYHATQSLLAAVETSGLTPESKAELEHELNIKLVQFNTALVEAMGLHLEALLMPPSRTSVSGPAPQVFSLNPGLTRDHVTPGETFDVRLHITSANPWSVSASSPLSLAHATLTTPAGEHWQVQRTPSPGLDEIQSTVGEAMFRVTVPTDATPTQPYFSRPSIEQPYYDIADATLRGQSFAPYPVAGSVEFQYKGIPIRLSEVVQTEQREPGRGNFNEPLVITPGLSINIADPVAILPSSAHSVSVAVAVTNEEPDSEDAALALETPKGWEAEPAKVPLHLASGATMTERFTVTPAAASPSGAAEETTLRAVAIAGNTRYTSGFISAGYPGLRPYNLYRQATVQVHSIPVTVAPGTRVAYVMGTGDAVPEALRALGVPVDLLAPSDLLTADLSRYSTIMLGVRTYTADPTLPSASAALQHFAQVGGTVVIQYQSDDFPGTPFSLDLGRNPAKVVNESSAVDILAPGNPLLTTPNRITPADFTGWVEERGHGFAANWASQWTPLVEMADPAQAPQRGGLLVAPSGRGRYIYLALALYRQTPQGVSGAYRLLANIVSARSAPTSAPAQ
jgi:LmbE family N-acetylglucosaminyl deacetylase